MHGMVLLRVASMHGNRKVLLLNAKYWGESVFYCLNIENLGRSLEIKQKSRENGEYWGESVFYCLMLRNLGRTLKIKQKLRENGEYWGKRVDLYQKFKKGNQELRKNVKNYGRI